MPSLRAPSSLAATIVLACAALGATPSLADAACQTGAAGVPTSFVSVPPARPGDFDQCYVVPDGVTHVTIIAIGAPGGSSVPGSFGGRGSAAIANDVPVDAGATLDVQVGATAQPFAAIGFTAGNGAPPGSGSPRGGGGGGGSFVFLESGGVQQVPGSPFTIAVGGGGGGSGALTSRNGGDAPGGSGHAGVSGSNPAVYGQGATETSAGAGATGLAVRGQSGQFGSGGTGADTDNGCTFCGAGGGGGGGWYGGGGGAVGGGGGAGSSHVPDGCTPRTCFTSSASPSVTILAVADSALNAAPGAPSAAPLDAAAPHDGAFRLSWSTGDALSYTLQRRNAADTDWSTVATGLTDPSYTFGGTSGNAAVGEGTWTYRVVGVEAGDDVASDASDPVVVDRTAPSRPTAAADRSPEDASGGWYADTVTVSLSGSSDPALPDGSPGTGVTYDAPQTFSTAGTFTYSGVARDGGANASGPSDPVTVKVDTQAPQLAFTDCPTAVRTGDDETVHWTASDPGPGSGLVGPSSGDVTLETGTPSLSRSVEATAVDAVGHTTTARCTYVVDTVPSRPGAPTGAAATNGALSLAWTRPAFSDPGATLTYSVQRRSSAGAAWTRVASGLTKPSVKLDSEPEGAWVYRAVASDGYVSSPPSPDSRLIKVDRGAPSTPALAVADGQSPAYTASDGTAWYRDAVRLTLTGADDPLLADGSAGSGLAPFPAAFMDRTDGLHTVSKTVSDKAGNTSSPVTLRVAVDSKGPTVSFACPTGTVRRDAAAKAHYAAKDASSGVAGSTGGPVALDTSTSGTHTAQYTATDNVGHTTTAVCTYTVG